MGISFASVNFMLTSQSRNYIWYARQSETILQQLEQPQKLPDLLSFECLECMYQEVGTMKHRGGRRVVEDTRSVHGGNQEDVKYHAEL